MRSRDQIVAKLNEFLDAAHKRGVLEEDMNFMVVACEPSETAEHTATVFYHGNPKLLFEVTKQFLHLAQEHPDKFAGGDFDMRRAKLN